MTNQQVIFCIIENLHLENDTTFNLFDWTITNDKQLISKTIPNIQAVMGLSGFIFGNMLFEKTIAFQFYDFKDNVQPIDFVHSESGNLNALLSLIWLYKDNSIFSSTQIRQSLIRHDVQINSRNTFISNSLGNYNAINFTSDTINEIEKFNLHYFIEPLFFLSDNTSNTNSEQINYSRKAHRADIEDKFSKQTRIQRSFLILGIARTTSFLPMKIAFYINVLECLLLNDNAELNFKLQTYSANFIGNNYDDKILIRDTMNTSYDVRSKFFHGSNIKQNTEQLQKISNQLDDIVRRTLLKAISIKDTFNAEKPEVLTNYFKSIMFS